MSKREDYENRTEELLTPIAEVSQVEIYDVEYVKEGSDYYLRAYIDKPEGVNILDCENVSRALSEALDKADFIPDAYILEVSSPGLGRTLKKDKHLQKSIGEEVEIKLFKPIDKCKEFSGIIIRQGNGAGADSRMGRVRRDAAAGGRGRLCAGGRRLLCSGGGRYRVLHTIEKKQ